MTMRYPLAILAVAMATISSTGHAQEPNFPLKELASLLDQHGYSDVRSLVATNGTLELMARLSDGSPIRAAVDERRRTVTAYPATLMFVRYDVPAEPQMTFRELAALLDERVPGGTLVELKRNQGAYEVHLRSADGAAIGMLVDLSTRKIMPYHSLD